MSDGDHVGWIHRETGQLSTLAILVVNYASHRLVEENLVSSTGECFPGQIVVVDNFTSDRETRAMRDACKRHGWELIALSENVGFGRGNNIAAEHAISNGATELILLNPDASVTLDTVRALQSAVRADPMLQLAPRVLRPDGSLFTSEVDLYLDLGEMRGAWRREPSIDVRSIHTWVSGACFAMSAKLWRTVGGFDDDYFLYWEDVDLSRRVVQAGGRVRADEGLTAVHDEGSTHRRASKGRAKSPLYYYYNARNRLLYASKHLDPADQRRWLRETPRASYRLLLQGGRRQFVHPLRTFWPAIKGSIAGVQLLRLSRVQGGKGAP